MQPGDLFVGSFVNQQPIGYKFFDWPIHVTIMSWFRGAKPASVIIDGLSDKLRQFKTFKVSIGPEAHFGTGGSVLVNLVNTPTTFEQLYDIANQLISANGFKLVARRFSKYEPHVTAQKTERLNGGDSFLCSAVYVVKQTGLDKEVLAYVELK